MKPHEAIGVIKFIERFCDMNEDMIAFKYYGMLDCAKKALEKQIPIKPYYWGDGYDENGDLICDMAECPNCGNNDFEYCINNWGCKYCPDCGQALDWSETE